MDREWVADNGTGKNKSTHAACRSARLLDRINGSL
jgi:hypothetical protein